MKIVKIECIPVTMMRQPQQMRSGRPRPLPDEGPVIVKIHTDEGIVGAAEAGHSSIEYMGSTQDSVMGMINHLFAPYILLGEDPCQIDKLVTRMESMTKRNSQAIAAIDYVLHDIKGRKLGVPVYELLGGLCNPKVPIGMVVGFNTAEEAAANAKRAVAAGYNSLKMKVGHGTLAEDLANVKAIRDAVGWDVRLGVDANCRWNYYQALEALKALERFDPTLFWAEQPVPWWDIDGMAKLRQKVGIPICADESAYELGHVLQIIERKAADALFIKLAKVGGICKGQKWVALAEAAGMPVMCGSLGGSLESAAQGHFIAGIAWMGQIEQESIGALNMHGGLDTVSQPKDDVVKKPPRYEKGYFYPPDGPGLGMELNEDIIKEWITPGKKPTVVEK